jgi:hypothetical protein
LLHIPFTSFLLTSRQRWCACAALQPAPTGQQQQTGPEQQGADYEEPARCCKQLNVILITKKKLWLQNAACESAVRDRRQTAATIGCLVTPKDASSTYRDANRPNQPCCLLSIDPSGLSLSLSIIPYSPAAYFCKHISN